ncbi:uncharacterized protein LOC121515682 [Cheilinus undulatus]|uniref:uncharacterized protein LOC121515682 n=1 Tax=Cheilinus undulatus TaxID=241271 RepID=UPI001BD1F40F|nr:uncharacterized protein LOC121515682 [Cheilinus undulatus]
MGAEKNMFAALKQELEKHPVVSNLFCGFVMVGVEKMLEVEFACPCYPAWWTGVFVALFFVIPASTAFCLMLLIHGCGYKNMAYSFLSALSWVALLLLDGRYVVCATTDRPGTFVSAKETFLKWCTPNNTTPNLTDELRYRSRWFHIWSQVAGIVILSILLVMFIMQMVLERRSRKPENGGQPGQKKKPGEPNSPETLHLQEV